MSNRIKLEKAKDFHVPERYDMGASEIMAIMELRNSPGGFWDVVYETFKLGFLRGQSYQKKQTKKGGKAS